MKYKEYLQSEHWKNFRKEVLSIRKFCQACGKSKCKFNIHHITYNNIGKETYKDVLVLCSECHNRLHKKKKWIKKYKQGEPLNFTETKYPENIIYNSSNIFRTCPRCLEPHSIFYRLYKNGEKALAMACPHSKPHVRFIRMEEGLDIPSLSRNH